MKAEESRSMGKSYEIDKLLVAHSKGIVFGQEQMLKIFLDIVDDEIEEYEKLKEYHYTTMQEAEMYDDFINSLNKLKEKFEKVKK